MAAAGTTVSAVVDTPKMVFCQKCSQIMTPSVDNGRMVYVCDSEQHKGHREIEEASTDNICVYKVSLKIKSLRTPRLHLMLLLSFMLLLLLH